MRSQLGALAFRHVVPWSSRIAYVVLGLGSLVIGLAGAAAMVEALIRTGDMDLAWELLATGIGVALVVVGAMSGLTAARSSIEAHHLAIDRHEGGLRVWGKGTEHVVLWSDVTRFVRGPFGAIVGVEDRSGIVHPIPGALVGRGDLLVVLARAIHDDALELVQSVRDGERALLFPIDAERRIEIDARGVRWSELRYAGLVVRPHGDVSWTRIDRVEIAASSFSSFTNEPHERSEAPRTRVCLTLDGPESDVISFDFASDDGMRCAVLVDELRRRTIPVTPYRGVVAHACAECT